MSVVPVARNAVIALLKEHGPLCANDIDTYLGWASGRAAGIIGNTRYSHPKTFFRKVKYTLQKDKTRGREIPHYAAEAGEDEPRPKFGLAAHRRRNKLYRERRRSLLRVSNVVRKGDGTERVASPWNGLLPVGRWDTAPEPDSETIQAVGL